MKTRTLALASLLALGVAGCSHPPPPPPPSAASDCPDPAPGQIFGSPAPTAVTDQIVNSAAAGQPLSLKLQYAAGLGVCADGKTGDIHLYGDKAASAQFTLTFAQDLSGQAKWPTDPTQALQIADKPDGPFAAPPASAWNPAPAVDGAGAALLFTVPYEAGHTYYYRLQYLDANNTLQTVEPKIINHAPPAAH